MAQTTATPSDTTATTPETHSAATELGVLPENGLVLLGTFVKPETSTALIRTPNGKTETVTRGDKIGRYTVVAIDDGKLHIASSGGRSRALTLPGKG